MEWLKALHNFAHYTGHKKINKKRDVSVFQVSGFISFRTDVSIYTNLVIFGDQNLNCHLGHGGS